ncbi:MAG: hypothetical protein KUG68_09020 [Flavobacteriaceae bacterium]|nr:hypothetical protein [Flavobacteriaceae bacterium]
MDQLETFKKQWQDREQDLPKLSYDSIYKMLLKKSSSIVKWIFLISIAELLFWISLNFLMPESQKAIVNDMGIGNVVFYSNIFHFIIFGIFIVYFYKNYQSIQVTDNTKSLMSSILKTRKTVRYFVFYNVGMFILSSILLNVFFYNRSDQLYEVMDFAAKGVPQDSFASVFIISQIIAGVVFVAILILFYWLIYGILLKRLKRNYKELKKMEM